MITGELKNAYGINAEVVIGRLLLGKELGIYNESGNLTFDNDGFQVTNGVDTVSINPNASSIFNIKNKDGNVLSFDKSGNLVVVGEITATKLTLLDDTEINAEHISGLSDVAFSGKYSDLIESPDMSVYFETGKDYGVIADGKDGIKVSAKGLLQASNAIIYGTIYASAGWFKGSVEASSFKLEDASISIEEKEITQTAYSIGDNGFLMGAQARIIRNMFTIDSAYGMYVTNDIYSDSIFANKVYGGHVSGSSGAFSRLGANTFYLAGQSVQPYIYDSDWLYPTLEEFSNYGDSQSVKYRKVGKLVTIQGIVKSNATILAGGSGNIFTLPDGYKPSSTIYKLCQGSYSNHWLLTVSSNGSVTLNRYSKGGTYVDLSTDAWLPFYCTFMID